MSETTEIEIRDPAEIIRERIKKEFAALIPEETWDALVESVIKDFTVSKSDRFGNKTKAEAEVLIHNALKGEIKMKIAENLKTYLGEINVEELIERIVRENREIMITGFLTSVVESFIQPVMAAVPRYTQCNSCGAVHAGYSSICPVCKQ